MNKYRFFYSLIWTHFPYLLLLYFITLISGNIFHFSTLFGSTVLVSQYYFRIRGTLKMFHESYITHSYTNSTTRVKPRVSHLYKPYFFYFFSSLCFLTFYFYLQKSYADCILVQIRLGWNNKKSLGSPNKWWWNKTSKVSINSAILIHLTLTDALTTSFNWISPKLNPIFVCFF